MCSMPTDSRMSSGVTPRRLLLLGLELAVRRRGRVDDQALRVADVGQQAEQLHAVDEPLARLGAALDAERHEPAVAALEDALASSWVGCDWRPG